MRKWLVIAIVIIGGGTLFLWLRSFVDHGEGGWEDKVEAALKSKECVSAPVIRYGSLRYDGPLIDSHYHIPHFDSPPPWARTGGRPYMGDNITIGDIVCTLQQENTMKAFAFFPVFPGGHTQEFLDLAYGAMS